jgi:CheY-like chemotaxis protein
MPTTTSQRILIVDDDDMQQRLLQMLLGIRGYEVISAMTGEQAKRRLAEGKIDMILLDLVMPELDGISFLRWMRNEARITTPVIIVSSKKEGVLDALEDVGNTTFQRKPVDLEGLTDEIARILKAV